jgi:hypothetical protein
MNMPMDKKDKKKALDLMIVIGGKPGKGKMGEDDEMESKNHKGCKCPCCGAPCEDCMDEEHEDDMEESEKDEY